MATSAGHGLTLASFFRDGGLIVHANCIQSNRNGKEFTGMVTRFFLRNFDLSGIKGERKEFDISLWLHLLDHGKHD